MRGSSGSTSRPSRPLRIATTRSRTASAVGPLAFARFEPSAEALAVRRDFDRFPRGFSRRRLASSATASSMRSTHIAGGGLSTLASRSHANGLAATFVAAESAAASAATPSSGRNTPMPMRSIRPNTPSFCAAMPTAPHAPHCTLEATAPVSLAADAARSSAALAPE